MSTCWEIIFSRSNGQFRTPKLYGYDGSPSCSTPMTRFVTRLVARQDFLSLAEFIREKYEADMTSEQWDNFAGDMFTGFDTDRTMLYFSNELMLHSITQPYINYIDSVSKQNTISSAYDVILANPPLQVQSMQKVSMIT